MKKTIHDIVEYGTLEELKELLKQGADINNIDDDFRATPLHRAISRRQNEKALYLLEQGADTTIQAIEGDTPLHYAAEYNNIIVAKAILEKDTKSLHIANKNGQQPLRIAIGNANKSPFPMVELFLQKGADKNHGYNLEMVKMLNIDELTKLFERY